MYNTLQSSFNDALKREGKTMYSYSDSTQYNVIFRRNKDTNRLRDNVSIFYAIDSGIRCGQLISYNSNTYITVNQETAENDIYYKSDLFKTNIVMNYIADNKEYNIPAFANDVQSALTVDSNVISMTGGNAMILADPLSLPERLQNGNNINCMGGVWKVENTIYKDDVVYIYIERTVSSTTYTLSIIADESYEQGKSIQFVAQAKANNTIISNANITRTSSSNDIAMVDETGLVTFLTIGSVTITANWKEHNILTSKAITVVAPPEYHLVIHAEDSYTTADTPTLTATATMNGIEDTEAVITWLSSDESIAIIDNSGNTVFLAEGSVTFTASWDEHDITASKTVEITTPTSSYIYTCMITNTVTSWKEYNDSTNIASIKIGGSARPLMCRFYDSSNTEVSLIPVWNVDTSMLTASQQAKIKVTYNESYPLRVYVAAEYDESLINKQILVTLSDSTGTCEPKTVPMNITAYT